MKKLVWVVITALGVFISVSVFAYGSQNDLKVYSMMDSDSMSSMMGGMMSGQSR